MKVATCTVDITPECEVNLLGYISKNRMQPAKGVHDTPLAIALYLEIENAKILFLSIDVLMVCESKLKDLKNSICEKLHIEQKNIIISAIHSHSLANGFNDRELLGIGTNEMYHSLVCNRIIDKIANLNTQLVEVKAYIGKCKIHGFYSNRNDKTYPFEDNAVLIKFMQEEKMIAAMCNFNCHATVLGPQNMYISSDLLGTVRSLLAKEWKVIPYTFSGASGDISTRQYREGNDFTELERVGKGIVNVLKSIQCFEELNITSFSIKEYDYPIHYDNTVFFMKYQSEINKIKKRLEEPLISLDTKKLYTTELSILKEKMNVNTVDFHVKGKVIYLQDVTIVTFPGELTSMFGLQLLNKCKTKHFLLIGYADDYQGYFIEAKEYGKTYESRATYVPQEESERIIKGIEELL